MRTKEDVERYLLDLDLPYEQLEDGVYRIYDEGDEDFEGVLVRISDPIVTFTLRLMKIPTKNLEGFYKKLLELNAELLAGAYAISGEYVIITDTLQLENLDFNEFQASVECIAMALEKDYPVLREFRD